MKTISKITALICLLSGFILTGCNDSDEPGDVGAYPEYLNVRIYDKDGNNLLDSKNPNNVIYKVEADVWPSEQATHLQAPYEYTKEDISNPNLEISEVPRIKLACDENSETEYHYEFFPHLVHGGYYFTRTDSYILILYIPDEAPRRFDILYQSYTHDNPLQKKYGNYRWTVNGEVLPDNYLTVII